jgi:sporulation protein YlmC with PRC-barrel domain
MFARYMTAGLIGSALMASVAFAQNPPASPQPTPNAQGSMTESAVQGDWRTSKVVGLYVYNDNNENIGSINDLLMDKNGNIKAAVIGVGGFLGVGEHLVAIAFDKIKFSDQPVAQSSASSGSGSTNRPSSTTGSASSTSSSKNQWSPDHAVFNANKDQLKGMPEFKYSG